MEKYTYKDSGIEWLNEIPTHWKVNKIKRGCKDIDTGKTPSTSVSEYFLDGTIEWYSPECFNNTLWIDKPKKLINPKAVNDGQVKIYPKNSIYFVAVGATAGKVGIISKPASCNQQINILQTNFKLIPEYLAYQFKLLETEIIKFAQYATLPILNQAKTGNLIMVFPPKQEQIAIANYLDEACKRLDSIIAIKEEQLKKLKNSLGNKINETIKRGVKNFETKTSRKDFIGEIPKHYKVNKLKHITTKVTDGVHFTPNYLNNPNENSIPFLRVTDVQVDKIDLNRTKFIDVNEHNELIKRCNPEKGDLLLSKNGTIGITKVVDWDWDFSIFVSLCLIKPDRQLNVDYLNYFFKSEIMDFQIKNGSKQITVTNLHLDKIREFYIVTPPLNEQIEIVKKLKAIEVKFKISFKNLKSQIKTLKAYRKSLIHECVTGKKQVADISSKKKEKASV